MYFLISSSDGDTSVTLYTHSELCQDLNDLEPGHKVSDFMSKVESSDPNYWGRRVLLIKGEIVVPKAKEVVTKVEVE